MPRSSADTDSHTYHSFPKAPKGVTILTFLLTWCLCPTKLKPYLQNRGHGAEPLSGACSALREMTTLLPLHSMTRRQEAQARTPGELDPEPGSQAEPQRLFPLWKKLRGFQASVWGTAGPESTPSFLLPEVVLLAAARPSPLLPLRPAGPFRATGQPQTSKATLIKNAALPLRPPARPPAGQWRRRQRRRDYNSQRATLRDAALNQWQLPPA